MSSKEFLSPTNIFSDRRLSLSSNQSPRRLQRSKFDDSAVFDIAPKNDDEAELRERQKKKLLELHQNNILSPGTPSDRRRSALSSIEGLTNSQLTEHFSNCIKLSAENKITMKNAFGLYLIDYMQEMLTRKEETNFQVASCSLDASAKIYSYRVDFVHSEAYKMVGGLGRTEAQLKENSPESNLNPDHENVIDKKKKKRRNKKTIEKNPKLLNVSKFDLEFEVDPLFHKTSAAFDEGGTTGLLFNHLFVQDYGCELVFDSNVKLRKHNSVKSKKKIHYIDLKEIKDMYAAIDWQSLSICPAFDDFEFTNWNNEDKFSDVINKLTKSHKVFDMDKEFDPIPEEPGPEFDQKEVDHYEYNDGDDNHNVENDDDDDCSENNINQTNCVDLISQRLSSVSSLKHILSSEPSEYSYFNKNIIETWHGPHHWKILAKSNGIKKCDVKESRKDHRAKKEAFIINFSEQPSDKLFKVTRASTTLSKSTIEKYNKEQTTLPQDLEYDEKDLFKCFFKNLFLLPKIVPSTEPLDENILNYDYSNSNDCQNYCPAIMSDGGGGGEDDDDDIGNFVNGEDNSIDLFGQTLDATAFQDNPFNGTLLAGDNLVQQPYKVAKINIDYARTAKRLDVKKLKSCIWTILTENDDGIEKEVCADSKKMTQEISFLKICLELPNKVSKSMAKNLSVPIAFVCLLHLANEKTLKILGQSTMEDLKILQDVC